MDEVEMNYRGTKKEKGGGGGQGGRLTGKFAALCRVGEDDRQSARRLDERKRRAALHPATTDDTMRD